MMKIEQGMIKIPEGIFRRCKRCGKEVVYIKNQCSICSGATTATKPK